MVQNRVATHLENLEKLANLTLVRSKLGKLGKVGEFVVCLWCAAAVPIATRKTLPEYC